MPASHVYGTPPAGAAYYTIGFGIGATNGNGTSVYRIGDFNAFREVK